MEWWVTARQDYEIFTSELTIVEASAGSPEAAQRRLSVLGEIPELAIDEEVQALAELLVAKGGIPAFAETDAACSGGSGTQNRFPPHLELPSHRQRNQEADYSLHLCRSRLSVSQDMHTHGFTSGVKRRCIETKSLTRSARIAIHMPQAITIISRRWSRSLNPGRVGRVVCLWIEETEQSA